MRTFLTLVLCLIVVKAVGNKQAYPKLEWIQFFKFLGEMILTLFCIGVFVLAMLFFFFGQNRP
jgi:hypothetical protein